MQTNKPKTKSASGWTYTVLEVLTQLRRMNVVDYLEEIIENNDCTSLVLVVKHNRFYREFITAHRFSVANYHVNYGNEHYRARTAYKTAKQIKEIVLREKIEEEPKQGYNRENRKANKFI